MASCYRFLPPFVVALCTACGPGATAQAVRPDDKTAGEALDEPSAGGSTVCAKPPEKGEPLVVDWKTAQQLELTVAMQKNVAVVAYDCKSIRLLKCGVKGSYGFTSVPSVLQEAVQIADADELAVNLPLGGASLGGEVKRGASIDIAIAYVGKQAALNEIVTKSDLVGSECSEATHFVRGASIGAFVMATGSQGEVRAAAEIFGAGASGKSSSNKKKLNSAGDVKACSAVKAGSEKPPDGCGALIRLELYSIASARPDKEQKESKGAPPLANTCPEGYAPSAGHCVKKSSDVARRCEPGDIEDCKAQCAKGSADSCFNAGAHLQETKQEGFVERLTKACDGNVGRACQRLAIHYAPGLLNADPAKSFGYARKGCDLLVPQACLYEGEFDRNKPWSERFGYIKRACDLGYWPGCREYARIQLEGRDGIPRKTASGLSMLDRACDAGNGRACGHLAEVYEKGKFFAGMDTDVKPDATKAAAYQKKACDLGSSGAHQRCPN